VTTTANVLGELPPVALTPGEFAWFTDFLRRRTGIELKSGKESLVMGRLERRLRHHGVRTYTEYFQLLGRQENPEETRMAIDLMTTNETYFFREQQHFTLLPSLVSVVKEARPVRVWSAASSTGEEAYSIAMVLADCLGERSWEIVGTDLSRRVVATAGRGLFPVEAAERIPAPLRRAYCLKGRDEYEGMFTVRSELRRRVRFQTINLTQTLPDLGLFDVIFLRNVMIYFSGDTKRQVVERILTLLRPGGTLLIGHAETLTGLGTGLKLVGPSVYRRPES
jgi:chemotaxis protein methyltransferase CheR